MLGWITRIGDVIRQQSMLAETIEENSDHGAGGSDAGADTRSATEEVYPLPDFQAERDRRGIQIDEARENWFIYEVLVPEYWARVGDNRKRTQEAVDAGERFEREQEKDGAQVVADRVKEGRNADATDVIDGNSAATPAARTADRIAAKLESYGAPSSGAPAKDSSMDLGAEL